MKQNSLENYIDQEKGEIVVPIEGVEGKYEQFKKYHEVLYRDEIRIPISLINHPISRAMTIFGIKRTINAKNRKLKTNIKELKGKTVDLNVIRAQKENKAFLANEIKAYERLKELLESTKKGGKKK